MINEEFNDAMCRLRQAEEDLNKALRDVAVTINDVQIDEAYNKGLQDLYNAIYTLIMPSVRLCHLKIPSMRISEMRKIFGTGYLDEIIVNNTPEEIIDKVNQWKAEKDKEEQELHVGDEIICTYDCSMDYNKTFIYLGRDEYHMKMFDLDKMRAEFTNNFVHYRKTGKHYDSIPLPKEINSL